MNVYVHPTAFVYDDYAKLFLMDSIRRHTRFLWCRKHYQQRAFRNLYIMRMRISLE